MSANRELLNDIYQNAEMGILTIPRLLTATKDEAFGKILTAQLAEYQCIADEARKLMTLRNIGLKEPGEFSKLRSTLMTEFMTMKDSSVSHLAEMMVQGNTMGTTAITRRLHEHPEADPEVLALAQKLRKTTDANTEQIKKFL